MSEQVQCKTLSCSQSIEYLLQGGVLAYPTEAIYGLGCLPQYTPAIERLLQIKGRDADKGLILIAADFTQIQSYIAPISAEIRQRLETPGFITWLLPAAEQCSTLLTGTHRTIAIRITAHPVVCALCIGTHSPLISTSANRSGQAPARTLPDLDVIAMQLDGICEGSLGDYQQPSTIYDAMTGHVIRSGEEQ